MPSDSFLALKSFLESTPVARQAAAPLARSAEVAVMLDGDELARFTMESGQPQLLHEPARAPDFTLRVPAGAVNQITALKSDDVGEYGVAFFTLVIAGDPALKVRVHIDAPTIRLLGGGYLGVLAVGGMKVSWWLLGKGIKNPKAAIDRLRAAR
jgi:hypothetical protein